VPRAKADHVTPDDRTATNPSGHSYTQDPPYAVLDREADLRQAHQHFTQLLGADRPALSDPAPRLPS